MDAALVHEAQRESFLTDVLEGLSRQQKSLPSRWLYDTRGSELFEQITRLEEYYPTRTETAILGDYVGEIADFCGRHVNLLEYGAGAGIKTEMLISSLIEPSSYVPIDISGPFLDLTAERFRARFAELPVNPIVSDFTSDFAIPASILREGRRVAFFPGSTIGNLNTREAGLFLHRMRKQVGPKGAAVIGVDLKKPLDVLIPAYDDNKGVTAEFNLNILHRINRELDGCFATLMFMHRALWNDSDSAVEMHLLSTIDQMVSIAGKRFRFRCGETIHTESSRKYEIEEFRTLAANHGWHTHRVWSDAKAQFAVFGLI